MSLEKESKMLEQGLIAWLICGAAVLTVWAVIYASAVYVFSFIKGSSGWIWAAVAATVITIAAILTAKKFLWK
jgi:hypothetical protein